MKSLLLLVMLFSLCSLSSAQAAAKIDYVLPVLHVIKEVTLSPSYSCRTTDDFNKGYQQTALWVSEYSKCRSTPDLLFNGACGSDDYFQASTAGDDMALIADLGQNVLLEDLTAQRVFNLKAVAKDEAYTRFRSEAKVNNNHTYAVLLNKGDLRGLVIFTVIDHVKNERVVLKYAVKMYDVFPERRSSSDFSWEKKNSNK